MPHDRNGQLIKVGDKVKLDFTVKEVWPNATDCNVQLIGCTTRAYKGGSLPQVTCSSVLTRLNEMCDEASPPKFSDSEFAFSIGDRPTLNESGESGTVIGRAEMAYGENLYLLRYEAGDGRCVENWWGESAFDAK